MVVPGGCEAVEWLEHNAPRIVIANPSLMGVDGFGVIGELRKGAPESEVPAMFVSAVPSLRARANSAPSSGSRP